MIVKNEEKVLKRCLESVKKIVDEIIIIDTGSTDKTKDIAHSYTDNVYDFKWIDDFSKARNYSFSKATKDYILWLDADDIILDEDISKFIELKNTLNKTIDIVMMKYNVGFDENGNVNFSYYRERLLKREKNYKWESPIHEAITPIGNIEYSDICITHKKEEKTYSTRNLEIFEKLLDNKIPLDARQLYYYARELMYNSKYEKAISYFNIFLNNKDAWIENKINACLDLSNCYKEMGKDELSLSSLFRSFEYDTPRAEICTNIGIFFMQKMRYKEAIYWFEIAIKIKPNYNSGAFIQIDYYNYIPYLNLCVCYDKLKKYKKAKKYNDLAGKIKPNSKAYINNKKYFETKNIF
jgi:glycosyltransferase involved in cell wall biosynthesis